MITATRTGCEIDVRIVPRAKKTAIDGVRDGAVLIRVAAPPVDNAANDALIEFLSDTLRVPRRSIRIVSGERSRVKRVAIDHIHVSTLKAQLSMQDEP
ncbi:MAG TPA: DUF167 domain-containing protein [Vicinamibacterales bacterium]|nr:DUF167 domain-containing protein [Vicinamibacterales bacterium]